jgi:hypothetical protein
MDITNYEFGRIRVGGTGYTSDLIVRVDRVEPGWRRIEGHRLRLEDLGSVLREPPGILVVGTGYYGRMEVPAETLAALRSQGVATRIAPTGEAVEEFNRLRGEGADVAAALHLTC